MPSLLMPIEHDRESCDYCRRAQIEPECPRYRAQCRGCAVRALANGPLFTRSGLDGAVAAPYRKALSGIFGDAWRDGHALVKAEHERIKAAKRAAAL